MAWDDPITLTAADTRAVIAPAIGANCIAFEVGGVPLIEPVAENELRQRPSSGGCPILFPFPGRVPGGRYTFDGHDYQLPLHPPEYHSHMHGFALQHAWRVTERDAASCVCFFDWMLLTREETKGYPWPFVLTVRWSVGAGRLRADVTLDNEGDDDLPFGFGLHPYLTVATDAMLAVPATATWALENNISAGAPTPCTGPWPWATLPESSSLLLTRLPQATVEATAGAVAVRFPGSRFGEVVVYRPPARPAVCIEPWTSVAGAATRFPTGAPHGLLRLPAKTRWTAWMEIAPRQTPRAPKQ